MGEKTLNGLGHALLERARMIASRCGRDGRVLGADGMRSDLSEVKLILAVIERHLDTSSDGQVKP